MSKQRVSRISSVSAAPLFIPQLVSAGCIPLMSSNKLRQYGDVMKEAGLASVKETLICETRTVTIRNRVFITLILSRTDSLTHACRSSVK